MIREFMHISFTNKELCFLTCHLFLSSFLLYIMKNYSLPIFNCWFLPFLLFWQPKSITAHTGISKDDANSVIYIYIYNKNCNIIITYDDDVMLKFTWQVKSLSLTILKGVQKDPNTGENLSRNGQRVRMGDRNLQLIY